MIKFLGLQDFLIFNSSHSNSHSFLPENVNKISYQLVMSWRLIRIKPIENSMTLRDIRNRAKKTNIMLISIILRNSIIHFKHNSFLLILEHNCNTNVVSIFLTSSESTLISIFWNSISLLDVWKINVNMNLKINLTCQAIMDSCNWNIGSKIHFSLLVKQTKDCRITIFTK